MGAWTPPIRRCPCTGWCAMPSMVRRQRLWAGMLPTAAQIPHAATRLTSAGRHGSKIEEWTVCGRLQPGKRLMLLGLRPGWLVWHMQELSGQGHPSLPLLLSITSPFRRALITLCFAHCRAISFELPARPTPELRRRSNRLRQVIILSAQLI